MPDFPSASKAAACWSANANANTSPTPVCHTSISEFIPASPRGMASANVSCERVRPSVFCNVHRTAPNQGPKFHPTIPRKPPTGDQPSALSRTLVHGVPERTRSNTVARNRNTPNVPPTNNAVAERFEKPFPGSGADGHGEKYSMPAPASAAQNNAIEDAATMISVFQKLRRILRDQRHRERLTPNKVPGSRSRITSGSGGAQTVKSAEKNPANPRSRTESSVIFWLMDADEGLRCALAILPQAQPGPGQRPVCVGLREKFVPSNEK